MLENCFHEGRIEAGCDEAGRGCLAGPVFAAAVIWPENKILPGINDSKKLSAAKRDLLRKEIELHAIAYAVARVDQEEIDRINILNASFRAMHLALDQLQQEPEHLLIDGNRFKPYRNIAHTCIVGGDGKFTSIAAASILAKTYRDQYMDEIHKDHPFYGWNTNRGYATRKHREAIIQYGITAHHRLSFCRSLTGELPFDPVYSG